VPRCAIFSNASLTSTFRKIDDARAYPEACVDALTRAGWLAVMIPQEYGGAGLGLAEASVVMEEVNRCGGNAGACHGQMYNMGTLLRHGSDEQKRRYLPKIASGDLRLQSMGVTEPTTGTDTTKIKTTAVKQGDRYVVNGQKVWISRIQHSDLMILLARTTPLKDVKRKSEGMSIFIVDLHQAIGQGMTVNPIRNMVNHETNELFFDNLEIPAENLIGEEGKGFKYILDGLNAERTLIAAECIGDARWFVERSARYARERRVFDRPIGQNQGVQFPLAEAHIETEAADLTALACRASCLTPTNRVAQRPIWPSTWPPKPPGRRPTPPFRPMAALALPANTTSSASSAKPGCTKWRRSPPT